VRCIVNSRIASFHDRFQKPKSFAGQALLDYSAGSSGNAAVRVTRDIMTMGRRRFVSAHVL
jgi:hypothetical protein